jgi:large subunit ribosomal protein L30e
MARDKSTKKSSDTLNQRLALVAKSGKISLGYESTLESLRQGKAKLILIAANTPPLHRSEIECEFCICLASQTTLTW